MTLQRVDAAQVHERSAKAAAWLASKGAEPGDRVAIFGHNQLELLYLVVGAMRSGVVPVVINTSFPAANTDAILADCAASFVVDSMDDIDWTLAPAPLHDLPVCRPMLYTSGTTGTPKGVYSGLFPSEHARQYAQDEHELWDPRNEVHVCTPLYHSASLRIAIAGVNAGATIGVHTGPFDARAMVDALNRFDAITFLVPTHLRRLFAMDHPVPTQSRILLAGEPCPEPLKRKALELIPNLWEFYGSTEGQFTMISPQEWLEHPGSVGRARRHRRLHLENISHDGIGTVYVTAPAFARWSYFNDPERTAQAWNGDAFTAGDLGTIDDDGYLYLVSRREDLIISGGVNVYPAMVESALLEHPAVHEVAVFGMEDQAWGQRVCAAVVADSAAGIADFLRTRLSGPMRPKQLLMLPALPRTATGKIDRKTLRTKAAEDAQ